MDAMDLCAVKQDSWSEQQSYDADMLIDALAKRLEDLCPRGYYFGAHPCDAADFGVWELEEVYAQNAY